MGASEYKTIVRSYLRVGLVSSKFQDAESHGVKFKYVAAPISSFTKEELRALIDELNSLSEHVGCVVFEAKETTKSDLVIFAGNLERFSMLSAARGVTSRVLYFQDTRSWWYGGSHLLPKLDDISAFLKYHVGRRRCVTFGQSSGGYAALVIGAQHKHYDVVACSPQTFADASSKSRIHMAKGLGGQRTPDYLYDIAKLYRFSRRSGFVAAIYSASEYQNPYQSHFWMDHLHLARLVNVKTIQVFLAASANHSVVFQRAKVFSQFLASLMQIDDGRLELKNSLVQELVEDLHQECLGEERSG